MSRLPREKTLDTFEQSRLPRKIASALGHRKPALESKQTEEGQ